MIPTFCGQHIFSDCPCEKIDKLIGMPTCVAKDAPLLNGNHNCFSCGKFRVTVAAGEFDDNYFRHILIDKDAIGDLQFKGKRIINLIEVESLPDMKSCGVIFQTEDGKIEKIMVKDKTE